MGNYLKGNQSSNTKQLGMNNPLPPNITIKDCEKWIPPISTVRVVKVYDGDTITIATRMPGYPSSKIFKFQVRLNGIDAPEMKSKDPIEKQAAINSKEALRKKIFGKDIILKNIKFEKYGRLLADIYKGSNCINNWLIDTRMAILYDGKTKPVIENWLEFQGSGKLQIADNSKKITKPKKQVEKGPKLTKKRSLQRTNDKKKRANKKDRFIVDNDDSGYVDNDSDEDFDVEDY